MKKAIGFIIVAAVLGAVGFTEDYFEFLGNISPDGFWAPSVAFAGAFLCLFMAFIQSLEQKPSSGAMVLLMMSFFLLGLVVNKIGRDAPETIKVTGGFEGWLPDDRWALLQKDTAPLRMGELFSLAFDDDFAQKSLGLIDVSLTRNERIVAQEPVMWTEWSVSVTCKARSIPLRYRKYAPVGLVVSYFGMKAQFARKWKDAVTTKFKREQAVHNFLTELSICGAEPGAILKIAKAISLNDHEEAVKAAFAAHLKKLEAKP